MAKTLTMRAVGDIILSRQNPDAVFRYSAGLIQEADIAFFNCETPYAESGAPGLAPHGATPHNPRNLPAIKNAGFHACTLANNHTMDWGTYAVVECRDRLEEMGIAVCGAGRDVHEARQPAVVQRDGTRVAFVGYCCVGPNLSLAEEGKPGCAMVRARTIYEPMDYQPGTPATRVLSYPYKEDLDNMVEDIQRARDMADIVVATYHWGIHALPVAIPDYEFDVGRAAVDAGADLVLGHHPHILKGAEVYKGKAIIHSMSHFILDAFVRPDETVHDERLLVPSYFNILKQIYPWHHPDQEKTVLINCQIQDKQIRQVSYTPVMLDQYWSDPEPLRHSDRRAQEIKAYMDDITQEAKLDTRYAWDGDEVVIKTD